MSTINRWAWFSLTALVGSSLTLLSAGSIFLFPLLLTVGFVLGAVQLQLVGRGHGLRWGWIVRSGLGWLIGLVTGLALVWGVGVLLAGNGANPALAVVLAQAVSLYVLIFTVMGVVQSGALGANRIRWILASAGGGLLLGLASLLGCTLFGTTFYSVVLFGQDVSGVCVNIGLTLPRLQSSEPLFALTAATVVAHLFGWLAYSAVTTWAFPTNTI